MFLYSAPAESHLFTFIVRKGILNTNFFGKRARTICAFNAVSVLMLPLALILTMPSKYFRALPFLTAAILVWIVALSMSAPLVLAHSKSVPSTIPPLRPRS